MVDFKAGKYYTLDYEKIFDTYDLRAWPNFTRELDKFKNGKKIKCIEAEKYEKVEENDFVCSLIFENSHNGSWGYTRELASLFREYNPYEQEEMEL